MSDEKSKHPCFVDSNIWLYILLPGQDVNKGKTARELVEFERPHIVISTQVVNEVITWLSLKFFGKTKFNPT